MDLCVDDVNIRHGVRDLGRLVGRKKRLEKVISNDAN